MSTGAMRVAEPPAPVRARNRSLDGLRAVAAMTVVGYHVASWSGHTQGHGVPELASALKGGVALFFVISGYVLYHPTADALRGHRPAPPLGGFLIRRALRILPAYWLALTLWLLLAALTGAGLAGSLRIADWWRYFGLIQIYDPHTVPGGLGVAWSLCVELTFYLGLAGFIALMAANRRRELRVEGWGGELAPAAVLVAGTCLLRYGMTRSLTARVPESHSVLASSLPAFVDWFALGIALAVLASRWRQGELLLVRRWAQQTPVCWLLGILVMALSIPLQGGDLYLPLDSLGAHLCLGFGSALLVLSSVARDGRDHGSRAGTVLGSQPMAWLGRISFGIYLYHVPVLLMSRRALRLGVDPNHVGALSAGRTLVLAAATIVGGVAIGAGSWYLVELPVQRLFLDRRASARPLAGVALADGR